MKEYVVHQYIICIYEKKRKLYVYDVYEGLCILNGVESSLA